MLSVNEYEIARLDLHDCTEESPVIVLTTTRYENLTIAALGSGQNP